MTVITCVWVKCENNIRLGDSTFCNAAQIEVQNALGLYSICITRRTKRQREVKK